MSSSLRFIKIISTGFVVLFFMLLVFFWCNWICDIYLVEDILPLEAKKVVIEPSILVPEEIENNPNVVEHSKVEASFGLTKIMTLGISNYINDTLEKVENSIYSYSDLVNWEGVYFDKKTGLIIRHRIYDEKGPDNNKYKKSKTNHEFLKSH